MIVKTATAALVVLATAAGWAQSTPPAASQVGAPIIRQKQALAGMSGISASGRPATTPPVQATLAERVLEMEGTLAKMHAVLKQMRVKATSSSGDPLVRSNLEMWQLLVGHLDNQLKELRVAMAVREDMESRRAAMYKQAEAKSDAAAQAARARNASKSPSPAAQGTGESTTGHAPTGAGDTPASPTGSSSSPN